MIKFPTFILVVVILASSILFLYFFLNLKNLKVSNYSSGGNELISDSLNNEIQDEKNEALRYSPPIDNFGERVTKKPFGIYINPKTSPIQPEKFTGYHTGVDFEIFPEEENKEIKIMSFCESTIVEKRYVNGYGGVLIENCEIEGELMTVLYGHLNLSSIQKEKGDKLIRGETIGVLGKGFSYETSGERKHLHFGIHKGKKIDFRGYVQNKTELREWIDPLTLL